MHQDRKQPVEPMEGARSAPVVRRKEARPVGMQEMGPGLYETIRSRLTELSLASSHERLSGT
jgi:hypothetical protein